MYVRMYILTRVYMHIYIYMYLFTYIWCRSNTLCRILFQPGGKYQVILSITQIYDYLLWLVFSTWYHSLSSLVTDCLVSCLPQRCHPHLPRPGHISIHGSTGWSPAMEWRPWSPVGVGFKHMFMFVCVPVPEEIIQFDKDFLKLGWNHRL